MSDLLPLIAATLQDKVAVEANKEISQLKKKLRQAYSVEVIRQSVSGTEENAMVDDDDSKEEQDTILTSFPFDRGQYGHNPNLLWELPLFEEEQGTCYLRDLRRCVVCVGDGFPVVSFDDQELNSAGHEGFLNGNCAVPTASECFVKFRFNSKRTWVQTSIHGWPRDEWEHLEEFPDSEDVIGYLVDTVAANHPNATIEFWQISFSVCNLHGRLKRSLPPPPPVTDLRIVTVRSKLRSVGNTEDEPAFQDTIRDILGLLDLARE